AGTCLLPLPKTRTIYENCTGGSPLRKRPAEPVRRHGACRFLPDGGTGAAGARGHAVRQRRLPDQRQARRRLPPRPGYVYAARQAAAALASELGDVDRSVELARQAESLRARFEQAFWCEELSTYALALDGDNRQCRVRTSNAGQCLFTGIASPEHARR